MVVLKIITSTLNVVLTVLPESSVAVQVTLVLPSLNTVPDAGTHVTSTESSTESVAVGES